MNLFRRFFARFRRHNIINDPKQTMDYVNTQIVNEDAFNCTSPHALPTKTICDCDQIYQIQHEILCIHQDVTVKDVQRLEDCIMDAYKNREQDMDSHSSYQDRDQIDIISPDYVPEHQQTQTFSNEVLLQREYSMEEETMAQNAFERKGFKVDIKTSQ
ncbi:uncharacterized protein LOC131669658 [Phymastichus coffea]|uniref:uncharacterized protein LOC131669658 n=1 Tax=Phymastichus coffea TaxID=108790 RepID=UPI00273B02E0|nr:uncharacterized protein LOC131669658 [Phymastichus coffea]